MRHDIEVLVAGRTDENRRGAVDTGAPIGREAWSWRRVMFHAGDVMWLWSDPPARREQAGHRPGIAPGPVDDDGRAGMIVRWRTMRIRGRPFEGTSVAIPAGVDLDEPVEHQDRRTRKATRKGGISAPELAEVHVWRVATIG